VQQTRVEVVHTVDLCSAAWLCPAGKHYGQQANLQCKWQMLAAAAVLRAAARAAKLCAKGLGLICLLHVILQCATSATSSKMK
jgi:hypothetical protein